MVEGLDLAKASKTISPLGRPKDLVKRAAILDAARGLFFAHGVMPVSIDAIARKANVSRMTVYAHFGDKETLFREVIKRQATTLADAIAFLPAESKSGIDSLGKELLTFGNTFVSFLSRPDIQAWNRLRREEARNYPDLAKLFNQGASVVMLTLQKRLGTAHAQGQLQISDPESAARQLLGMLASVDVGSPIGSPQQQTSATLKRHVEGCVSTFLRAYRPSGR